MINRVARLSSQPFAAGQIAFLLAITGVGLQSFAALMIMADEQRVPGAVGDERGEKRKCDDFTALYSMDTAGPVAPSRSLGDPSGKLVI